MLTKILRKVRSVDMLASDLSASVIEALTIPIFALLLDKIETMIRLRLNTVSAFIHTLDLVPVGEHFQALSCRASSLTAKSLTILCINTTAQHRYACRNINARSIMVRKMILGDWERRILEAYLKGERLKGYTALLSHMRKMGLKEIIEGCEYDLALVKKLLKLEETKH